MSSTAKTIVAVVVVIALAAGLYYWYAMNGFSAFPGYSTGINTQNDSTALPSGASASDAALQQDLNSINGNLQAAAADASAVNASVNAHASGSY